MLCCRIWIDFGPSPPLLFPSCFFCLCLFRDLVTPTPLKYLAYCPFSVLRLGQTVWKGQAIWLVLFCWLKLASLFLPCAVQTPGPSRAPVSSPGLTWPQQTLEKSQISFHILPPFMYWWARSVSPTRNLDWCGRNILLPFPKQRPPDKPTREIEGTIKGILRMGICQPICTFVDCKHMCLQIGVVSYKINN